MNTSNPWRQLIINADDFGHFRAVSRGILDGVAAGGVTAVGVMATGPAFDQMVPQLRHYSQVDTGVHLVLTLGAPLSATMRERYPEGFPGKGRLFRDLVSRRLPPSVVAGEWRLQIQHCLNAGLAPLFLNSHEHVHLLAPLWKIILELAATFAIPFIREPGPGIGPKFNKATVLRMMHLPNRQAPAYPSPKLLGSDCSGRLTLDCVEECLALLQPGDIAELMCHPGRDDVEEITDPALRAFHDWESEHRLVCSPKLKEVLDHWETRLVRFRDIL